MRCLRRLAKVAEQNVFCFERIIILDGISRYAYYRSIKRSTAQPFGGSNVQSFSRDKLMQEPPGPRRVHLALRNRDLDQHHVAEACNCNNTTVSKVVKGRNRTSLNQRIRDKVVELTGFEETWLFAHAEPPLQPEA